MTHSLHIACYAFGCFLMHRLDDDVMLLDFDVVAVHWPVGGYNSCLFPVSLSLRQPRIEARLHISQNCQILVCMHVHTPAHMCVCVCSVSISTPLPPSSLPASILSLHQGWWGSVYGKCKESNLSRFIVSPLTCNSSPFFHPIFPPGDPSLPAAEDPAVRSSAEDSSIFCMEFRAWQHASLVVSEHVLWITRNDGGPTAPWINPADWNNIPTQTMHLRSVSIFMHRCPLLFKQGGTEHADLPDNDPDIILLGCLSGLSMRATEWGDVDQMMLVTVTASLAQDGITSTCCRLHTGTFIEMFSEGHLRCKQARSAWCLFSSNAWQRNTA